TGSISLRKSPAAGRLVWPLSDRRPFLAERAVAKRHRCHVEEHPGDKSRPAYSAIAPPCMQNLQCPVKTRVADTREPPEQDGVLSRPQSAPAPIDPPEAAPPHHLKFAK